MFNLRAKKLQTTLREHKCDALLVSNPYNILYLTGFKSLAPEEREAFVLVTQKNLYLISDDRYISREETVDGISYRITNFDKRLFRHLEEIIAEERINRLGIETQDLKYSEYVELGKKLKTKIVPTKRLVMELRAIKDKSEITKIKRTCEIADQCLREVLRTIKIGQTEKEIAFKIEFWLKQKGHDVSFSPIVAVDQNASLPHYNTQTGSGRITRNCLLLIDYGAKVDDYCSDCTRMFFVGKPDQEMMNVYGKLLDVQERAIRQIKKVRQLKEVDLFCRKELRNSGLPELTHSTGHGVGLEIHEDPRVSIKSKDKIANNQIFTIEPGSYLPGKFGMRIEDMIWVKNGSPEVLTKLPKKLSELAL